MRRTLGSGTHDFANSAVKALRRPASPPVGSPLNQPILRFASFSLTHAKEELRKPAYSVPGSRALP